MKKPEHRRPKVQSLTDAAKQAKKRLEDVFVQRSHVRIAAGAVDVSNDDVTEDAGELLNATTLILSY